MDAEKKLADAECFGKPDSRNSLADHQLNVRQRKVLNRLLDGFEGKLRSPKWAALTKSSEDSAGRDIEDLLNRGILVKNPGGG